MREGVFHLQHVNAHHSTLKNWVNNWFKGVASKYLYRYVGWRGALSTCDLILQRLIEKLAGVGCMNYKAEQSLTKLTTLSHYYVFLGKKNLWARPLMVFIVSAS